jgi:CRP/FNR family transcriptional regulator
VVQAAVRREYEAEEIVFLEREPCAGLYVVDEGWFKAVRTSPEGREQALRFVGPGEVFNEVGVFAGAHNPATVVALEAGAVWLIDRNTIIRLMDRYPRLAHSVVENLARRVLHLASLAEDLSLRTVEARLARLLLDRAKEGVLHREHWATQAEMAARLGTVLDVLNRALQQLVNEELIEVERHQIRILDRDRLKAKALIT